MFQTNCTSRIIALRDALWKKYYPPAIRQFKPTGYDDQGLYINSDFFVLYKESDTVGENLGWLTIDSDDGQIRTLRPYNKGDSPEAIIRAFSLNALHLRALGPIVIYSLWGIGSEVGGRVGQYQQNTNTFVFTDVSNSVPVVSLLFKVIPLTLPDGSTARTPVKLIPYSEDGNERVSGDRYQTFETIWRFEIDDNNPQ
jgi:hypothetical protein